MNLSVLMSEEFMSYVFWLTSIKKCWLIEEACKISPVAVWLLTVCLVQAVYGPACRASPLRFHSVKRGHSCSDQHWNPPHPRQLHCCTNKGRAVCVKGLQLQLLMELIRLGCTTLIHFSRQHSIDAPLSTHKGLPGSNTCCLKSLQVQTKTALRSWTNIYLQTHAVFMKELFDHNSN